MLVGIAGKDGVGKSTLAGLLAVSMGNAAVMAIATPLRRHCIKEGLLSYKEAFSKPTSDYARKTLREESTRMKVCSGNKRIWLDYALMDWTYYASYFNFTFVQDVRYLCEAQAIKETGGKIIFVGDSSLTAEQQQEPSFADLPFVEQLADYRVEARNAKADVEVLQPILLEVNI